MRALEAERPLTPMSPITLHPLCDLRVELGVAIELGVSARGRRRIIPITGGTVDGDRLRGRVLAFGADWQTILADGTAELDARYAIETYDAALIDVRNFGYRHGPQDVIERLARGEEVDPALYYMRTHPRFETGDPRYQWLNRIICVGTGSRHRDHVRISIAEVL
jgi:hypothetical protein